MRSDDHHDHLELTPEYALARDAIDPRVAQPRRSVDVVLTDDGWRRLLAVADWHRLATPLRRHLTTSDVVAPAWVSEVLGQWALRETARSMIVTRTIDQALGALGEAGVPAMLLKGGALLETVYVSATDRDMSDVDVLVPDGRLDAAYTALRDAGFGSPLSPREHARERAMRRSRHHDAELVTADGLMPVELHWHITPAPAIRATLPIAAFWQCSRTSAATGHTVPSPEHLLLHLCLHFTTGREVRSEGALSQLRDIAWTLDREDVDGDLFVTVARDARVAGRCYLALFSADALGLGVPAGLLDALRPASFDTATGHRFVAERVLTETARAPADTDLLTPEGIRRLLRWGRHYLPTGRDGPEPLSRPQAILRTPVHALRHRRELAYDRELSRWVEQVTTPVTGSAT